MAIGLLMQFPGGTAEQYDAVMEKLGLEGNQGDWPDGIISHFAGAYPEGWCVVDVWESQDSFDRSCVIAWVPRLRKSACLSHR
jgi:hypothetical protein